MSALTHRQAKAFYDRLGARQDWQAFYEDPAIEVLLAHGRFDCARSVCEFGCGTGRLAARLLADQLPPAATYAALDLSSTMVGLASKRLRPWAGRSLVVRTNGAPAIPAAEGSFDRLIAAYVLDLLGDDDIAALVADARRVLRPGGLFCCVGLTNGRGPVSRLVCALWRRLHAWRPVLVGGCRPLEMRGRLDGGPWTLRHHAVVCSFGICSEIVISST